MGRYLIIDIGAGTMDILWYESEKNISYKAVIRSPTKYLADKIKIVKKDLILTGNEMGGGAISDIIKSKAKKYNVTMTKTAALTINHNLEKIKNFGITISDEITPQTNTNKCEFNLGDIQFQRINKIIQGFGVPFNFDVVAICAQDHGIPPNGISHLNFRHNLFKNILDKDSSPKSFLYDINNIPKTMNRLHSIAKDASKLPTKKIYVMDSGMAAILGASMDLQVKKKERVMVIDIATSHTVGAIIENETLISFFEYHTNNITPTKLDELIETLSNGKISHKKIIKEGGHGAYIIKNYKHIPIKKIIVTGPMRNMSIKCKSLLYFGSPWGDNMMTGTTGLMEAVRIKENLPIISYL